MADFRIELDCPNPLCKRPYHFTVYTIGGERPSVEGDTVVFRCANPHCTASILAAFVGERTVEVKWLGEHG